MLESTGEQQGGSKREVHQTIRGDGLALYNPVRQCWQPAADRLVSPLVWERMCGVVVEKKANIPCLSKLAKTTPGQ